MPFPQSVFVQSGRFSDVQVIGQGAAGLVYHARDNLGRSVAVKEALPTNQQFQRTIAKFEAESRIQAALNDPHIVAVYHLEVDPQTQERYLVCEYANQGSLASYLDAYGKMTEQQVIGIGLDICGALAKSSSRGVIHRDVKPANILLNSDANGQLTAKLGDFGIAQDRAARAVTTMPGTSHPGTPLYMAPEQSNVTNILDVGADIYALGVTLFEALTLTDYKLLPAQAEFPLHEHNPLTSSGMAAVLARALQPDRQKRYRTPQDMAYELQHITSVGMPAPRAAAAPRRNYLKWAWLPIGLLVAALIAFLLYRQNITSDQANVAIAQPSASNAASVPVSTITPLPSAAASVPASVPAASSAATADQMDVFTAVTQRKLLRCGVSQGDLPGFSFQDPQTKQWSGFDVDFCRAVAIALFNDPAKVEFVPLAGGDRFKAIRERRVDVIFRNTTWTAERDTGPERVDFGPTTFYDGQGFLVRATSGIAQSSDLNGRKVCVASGTTTETNIEDFKQQTNSTMEIVKRPTTSEVYASYERGECDAVTSDQSQLYVQKNCSNSRLSNGEPRFGGCSRLRSEDHVVLPEKISREPLGPVFIENDSKWRDIVSWVVNVMVNAEENDITSTNVERELFETTDRTRKQLLGTQGALSANLGVDRYFVINIIKQLGNYKEVYNRNLVDTQLLPPERGPNKAWNRRENGSEISGPIDMPSASGAPSGESGGGVLSSPPIGRLLTDPNPSP